MSKTLCERKKDLKHDLEAYMQLVCPARFAPTAVPSVGAWPIERNICAKPRKSKSAPGWSPTLSRFWN